MSEKLLDRLAAQVQSMRQLMPDWLCIYDPQGFRYLCWTAQRGYRWKEWMCLPALFPTYESAEAVLAELSELPFIVQIAPQVKCSDAQTAHLDTAPAPTKM